MADPKKTEITAVAPKQTELNPDAVARAATERADKLEAELAKLKAQIAATPAGPNVTLELDALRAENAHMREKFEVLMKRAEEAAGRVVLEGTDSEPTFINEKGEKVPEKFRGTIRYRLTQPHYRQGLYLQPGELLTVTDEVPGKKWVRVEERPATTIVEVDSAPAQRASAQQV